MNIEKNNRKTKTEKIAKFPIVLVGKSYWEGLITWIENTVLATEQNISPEDLDLFKLVDTVDDAVKCIDDFYGNYLDGCTFWIASAVIV